MKTSMLFLFCGLLSLTVRAQVPQGFTYQAVARSATGEPLVNKPLSVRLSVLDGSASGSAQYIESQTVTTNAFGLFCLTVGGGTPTKGTLSSINWGSGTKFLGVEVAFDGTTNYQNLGATQLLSVPFALYAANGGTPGPQGLKGDTGPKGDKGEPGSTGSVGPNGATGPQSLKGDKGDKGDKGGTGTTGPQGLTGPAGPQGNKEDTGPKGDKGDKGDTGAGAYTAGGGITINGSSIAAKDDSPTNELQMLSLSGQTLSLSSGGGTVTLPSNSGPWLVSGTSIYTSGNGFGKSGVPNYAVAMGNGSIATGNYSTAMGNGTYALGDNSMAIGSYNQGITDALLMIGNGTASTRSNALTVLKSGYVGIGTTTPLAPLHISGGPLLKVVNPVYYGSGQNQFNNNITTLINFDGTSNFAFKPGLLVDLDIVCKGVFCAVQSVTSSDARIKTVLGPTNAEQDLQTLCRLDITNYTYKDTVRLGHTPQKKVIAQQVEAVYPQAVQQRTDFIPDLYSVARVEPTPAELTLTLPMAHSLHAGEMVKLIDMQKGELVETVIRVGDPQTFVVSAKQTGAVEKLFVYGRQVSDFRVVDYEALSVLNISATQFLEARTRRLQAENAQLQAQLLATEKNLLTQLQTLESRLNQVAASKAKPSYSARQAHRRTYAVKTGPTPAKTVAIR